LFVSTQDYVRCGTASVTSSDILVTGELLCRVRLVSAFKGVTLNNASD